jgi:DNA-directed RNA polymerase subunit H
VKEKEHTGREFNPLEHKMVPNHEILNDEDLNKILSEFKVDKEQLPKIRISDPAAVSVKAKVGDVVRVTRESPTAGKSYFYRLVIA